MEDINKETNGINISGIAIYPNYKLVDGGNRVLVELSKDKFKSFSPHHVGPDGVLCDDLETFITWDRFSK